MKLWPLQSIFYLILARTSTGDLKSATEEFRKHVYLLVVVGIDFDGGLLNHFTKHYVNYVGIPPSNFRVIVQSNNIDLLGMDRARNTLTSFGIQHFSFWTSTYTGQEMTKKRKAARRALPNDAWIIHADSDEYHSLTVADLLVISSNGYNAVYGIYIDRLGAGGRLVNASSIGEMDTSFPLFCQVSRAILKIPCQKVIAHRNYLSPNQGSGMIAGGPPFKDNASMISSQTRVFPRFWATHHFKWTTSVIPLLRRRIELYKMKKYVWWVVSEKAVHFFENYSESPRFNFCIHAGCVKRELMEVPLLQRDFKQWTSKNFSMSEFSSNMPGC